ncbi:hypothetical protein ADJ73_04880 [Arsenicicoccus sp. oral taxon 190]|nr:hypothetical protein ADJ73_04880 [Arsenicicoccus sp. oral taxon 190]
MTRHRLTRLVRTRQVVWSGWGACAVMAATWANRSVSWTSTKSVQSRSRRLSMIHTWLGRTALSTRTALRAYLISDRRAGRPKPAASYQAVPRTPADSLASHRWRHVVPGWPSSQSSSRLVARVAEPSRVARGNCGVTGRQWQIRLTINGSSTDRAADPRSCPVAANWT